MFVGCLCVRIYVFMGLLLLMGVCGLCEVWVCEDVCVFVCGVC